MIFIPLVAWAPVGVGVLAVATLLPVAAVGTEAVREIWSQNALNTDVAAAMSCASVHWLAAKVESVNEAPESSQTQNQFAQLTSFKSSSPAPKRSCTQLRNVLKPGHWNGLVSPAGVNAVDAGGVADSWAQKLLNKDVAAITSCATVLHWLTAMVERVYIASEKWSQAQNQLPQPISFRSSSPVSEKRTVTQPCNVVKPGRRPGSVYCAEVSVSNSESSIKARILHSNRFSEVIARVAKALRKEGVNNNKRNISR